MIFPNDMDVTASPTAGHSIIADTQLYGHELEQRSPDALGDPSITASRARTGTASRKSELTLAAMIAARRREILEVRNAAQSVPRVGVPVSIRIKRLHRPSGRQLLVGSLALGVAAEGISNFGGTWYVLNSSGNPVTSGQSSSSTGGGYGY